jgi:acyl phosphate:glycerol-3-phosphate acyltransferase
MNKLLPIAVASYCLGSIPFGYLLVRFVRGEDVRQSGSGNIGATNVSRKSPGLGLITLLLDALKGAAGVWFAYRLSAGVTEIGKPYLPMAVAAFFAVLGHVFPVWLKFRGGKGVATGFGSFLVIMPRVVLIAVFIFLLVLALFRYVSLASIVAVASFPFLAVKEAPPLHHAAMAVVWIAATSLLIIERHHANIRRLVSGTESRLGATRA